MARPPSTRMATILNLACLECSPMNTTASKASTALNRVGPVVGFAIAEPHEVREWIESGQAVLIDVREQSEHDLERIEGAALCPLSSFDPVVVGRLAAGVPRVVLQCKAGRRSADAAQRLCDAGATRSCVVSMAGGIDAWKKSGLPVVRAGADACRFMPRATILMVSLIAVAGMLLVLGADARLAALPLALGCVLRLGPCGC